MVYCDLTNEQKLVSLKKEICIIEDVMTENEKNNGTIIGYNGVKNNIKFSSQTSREFLDIMLEYKHREYNNVKSLIKELK